MNKNQFRWYPLLFGIYPVLALLAYNLEEIPFSDGLRSLVLALLAALLLTLLLKRLLRDWARAGLLASVILIFFYSYGHLYNALQTASVAGVLLGRHRFLFPIWLVLLGAGAWAILKRVKDTAAWERALLAVSVTLLLLAGYQIGDYYLTSRAAPPEPQVSPLTSTDQALPDIYYIILDAYPRADALWDDYHFDNSEFLAQLESMGFYVARCSQSNYAQTKLSLSTSLQMDYVESFFPEARPEETSTLGLGSFIQNSLVRQYLESLGYQSVSFETGFNWSEIKNANLYLAPEALEQSSSQWFGRSNGFESLLIQSTAAILVSDVSVVLDPSPNISTTDQEHRELVLYVLEQLENLPTEPGPKFVFAHIVSPHEPFVFGPNGEPVPPGINFFQGFTDQILYLNSRLVEILPQMIESSATPPIIILQSDHGGRSSQAKRMYNFTAIYFPGGGAGNLYPTITPVNIFRTLFNTYFNADFELLEDASYYSSYNAPYDFRVIPNEAPGCGP